MAESIKMLFGLRTWVGPRKHVLDEVHIPPWEGAISRGEWATTKIQSMWDIDSVPQMVYVGSSQVEVVNKFT